MRFDGNNNGSHSQDGGDRPSLASVGAALRRQAEEAAHNVSTLQRSGVGIVTVLRKMEAGVQALSTRDLFWKVSTREACRKLMPQITSSVCRKTLSCSGP